MRLILTTMADELAEEAESEHSLLLVTQSDALRKRAREKAEELKLIDDKLEIKKKMNEKVMKTCLYIHFHFVSNLF